MFGSISVKTVTRTGEGILLLPSSRGGIFLSQSMSSCVASMDFTEMEIYFNIFDKEWKEEMKKIYIDTFAIKAFLLKCKHSVILHCLYYKIQKLIQLIPAYLLAGGISRRVRSPTGHSRTHALQRKRGFCRAAKLSTFEWSILQRWTKTTANE